MDHSLCISQLLVDVWVVARVGFFFFFFCFLWIKRHSCLHVNVYCHISGGNTQRRACWVIEKRIFNLIKPTRLFSKVAMVFFSLPQWWVACWGGKFT